jgi:hypothetical protein
MTASGLASLRAQAGVGDVGALRPRASGAAMFPVVTALLALGILFHKARLGERDWTSPHMAVSVAAIWALLAPASVGRLVTMLGVYLVVWAIDLPRAVNHIVFTALIALTLFAWLALEVARTRRWPEPATVHSHLAPLLRWGVLMMYAFAAVAKLNRGFFHSELSCAVTMYRRLDFVPFLPQAAWTAQPAIWGTVAVELALPLLLGFRRTRLAGIFVAIVFHAAMAASGHVPFSAFAMPMLAVFVPEDVPERLARVRARRPRLDGWFRAVAAVAGRRWVFPAAAMLWLLVIPVPRYAFVPRVIRETLFGEQLLALYGVYLAGLTALLVMALREPPRPFRFGGFRLPHPILFLGPALVLVNAIQPYLGLKTVGSFTMYSNLRTEGGEWNHLLVPSAVQVFPLQDDLVRIHDSSDERLSESAKRGTRWVWTELRAYLGARPEVSLTYERNGVRETVTRAGDHPVLGAPPGLLATKLLPFREVDPPGRSTCRW